MFIENKKNMKNALVKLLSIVFCLQIFTAVQSAAQDTTQFTSDELFTQARNIPKEKSNYPQIINLLKTALITSPDYADIRLFLGRVYTWSDQLDSARFQFNQVLAKDEKNIEAYSALYDLEYWNDNYTRALDHVNMALLHEPNSADLILRKAKALNALKDTRQALAFLKSYNNKNPYQDTTKSYYRDLRQSNTKNAVGVSYEYVYFDKRFTDPWHFASVDYTRNTSIGSITGTLLYSNRFRREGLQAELEAYPSLSKNIYAYVGAAYSEASIFPTFRGGVSLYYVLPKSFDAETGFRYLNFSSSKTYIYVLAIGKYSGDFYFNLKSYLTPDENAISHSYTLSAKYYFSDRFNVIGAQIGSGISTDDYMRNITGVGNLQSYKFGVNYSRDLSKNLTLASSGVWYYDEYSAGTWGSQFSAGVSLSKRF